LRLRERGLTDDARHIGLEDGRDEKRGTDEVLSVNGGEARVGRELPSKRPERRRSGRGSVVEERVPEREEGVLDVEGGSGSFGDGVPLGTRASNERR
jgi:hypothetical protein